MWPGRTVKAPNDPGRETFSTVVRHNIPHGAIIISCIVTSVQGIILPIGIEVHRRPDGECRTIVTGALRTVSGRSASFASGKRTDRRFVKYVPPFIRQAFAFASSLNKPFRTRLRLSFLPAECPIHTASSVKRRIEHL